LNEKIAKIVYQITQKLQEGEKIIKDFAKENIENNIHSSIKINMQQTLVKKFTEFTRKYKINQEIYMKKYKELVGEEDPTYLINSSKQENNPDSTINNFLLTTDNNSALQQRDNQLNNLLNSVNDLAQIFKDMQTLVMEQGSILDRIDYNIDIAATNVTSGKKSIVKANEYHKNNCFRNVIIVLIVCIFIEALLLIFKFI
jgi:syntaxin 16